MSENISSACVLHEHYKKLDTMPKRSEVSLMFYGTGGEALQKKTDVRKIGSTAPSFENLLLMNAAVVRPFPKCELGRQLGPFEANTTEPSYNSALKL